MFDIFYNDYSDSKHYINDILNILNERNTTSTKKTSVSEQILLLEEHVRILKLENKKLQEERKSQLNIIERLTENQDSDFRKETRNDFFFLSGFFFSQKDNSQDSRGRELTIFNSTLPLPPAHKHWDIYFQLCIWDDYHVFLIVTLVFTRGYLMRFTVLSNYYLSDWLMIQCLLVY